VQQRTVCPQNDGGNTDFRQPATEVAEDTERDMMAKRRPNRSSLALEIHVDFSNFL
jgi:hypothetical protein